MNNMKINRYHFNSKIRKKSYSHNLNNKQNREKNKGAFPNLFINSV